MRSGCLHGAAESSMFETQQTSAKYVTGQRSFIAAAEPQAARAGHVSVVVTTLTYAFGGSLHVPMSNSPAPSRPDTYAAGTQVKHDAIDMSNIHLHANIY